MEIYKNVLSQEFISCVLRDNEIAPFEDYIQSTKIWEKNILNQSTSVLIRLLTDMQTLRIKAALTKLGIIDKDYKKEFVAMSYQWPPLSYIPWHDDPQYDGAATIYLNEIWDINWGGLFLWKTHNNEIINAVPPIFNQCTVNSKKEMHATSMITPEAPIRKTIQCFWGPAVKT